MGMVFCATYRKYPLNAIETTEREIQSIFKFEPCAILNPSGQPISNNPAIIRQIQFIVYKSRKYRHC